MSSPDFVTYSFKTEINRFGMHVSFFQSATIEEEPKKEKGPPAAVLSLCSNMPEQILPGEKSSITVELSLV